MSLLRNNKELLLLIGNMAVAFLLTGFFFSFRYLEEVDIQLHDLYVIVLPLNVSLFLCVLINFFVFIFKGFLNKFSKSMTLWILIICNSLLLALVLYAFTIYSFFIEFGVETSLKPIVVYVFFFVSLMTVEVLLIRRFRKLRRTYKSIEA